MLSLLCLLGWQVLISFSSLHKMFQAHLIHFLSQIKIQSFIQGTWITSNVSHIWHEIKFWCYKTIWDYSFFTMVIEPSNVETVPFVSGYFKCQWSLLFIYYCWIWKQFDSLDSKSHKKPTHQEDFSTSPES